MTNCTDYDFDSCPPWRPKDNFQAIRLLAEKAGAASRESLAKQPPEVPLMEIYRQTMFPTTLDAVTKIHSALCADALALVAKKGADYNRAEQKSGDTLANLKTAKRIGLVDSSCTAILVRIMDKIMRLKSLCKPGEKPANTDEKVRDTVVDVINYVIYLYILWAEENDIAEA